MKPEELKKTVDFRLISKDVMRAELPHKINGSAQYAIDVQVPGMLYGAVVRAPVEGAAPEKFDEAKVMMIKGVVKAVKLPYGVGVIAETPWAAFAARGAVEGSVSWTKDGKAWGFDSEKGLVSFAATARDPNAKATDWFKLGDARAEMPKAASTFEAEYLCDYAYHAQMEPLNGVASVSPMGDSAECGAVPRARPWRSRRPPRRLVSTNKVTLHDTAWRRLWPARPPRHGFPGGCRAAVKGHRQAGENDVDAGGRHQEWPLPALSAHLLKAGFDASGKLVAWQHRLVGDRVTPFADPCATKGRQKDFILMLGADAKGYDVAHQLVEQISEDTGVRTAPLRGIGFTADSLPPKHCVDELAYQRSVDPVKYRLELLSKTPRAHKVMERAAQMADWGKKREGHGLGAAYIDYSGTQVAAVLEISVERSTGKIKVHNVWCAIDCGTAVQPDNVVAQTESSIVYGIGLALTERISIKDGAVKRLNFYDYIVSRNRDVPPMHVEVIQTDNHPTGVGPMATPLITPAISNAVMGLTGKRLRHAPFTEERVKKAIG